MPWKKADPVPETKALTQNSESDDTRDVGTTPAVTRRMKLGS